jgi:hypothetical protein
MKKTTLFVMLVLGISTALAQSGILNSPNSHPFTFNCGGQQVSVVAPSGSSANALVTTDNRVIVATSLTQVLSYTDPTTNQPVTQTSTSAFGPGHGQANGISTTSCVIEPFTFQDPQLGRVTVTGTVVGFFTPR